MLAKKYLLLLCCCTISGILLAQPTIKPVNNATVPAPTQVVQPLPAAYNSNATVNYVRVWEPTSPITNELLVPAKAVDEVKTTTAYHDGLGRSLQTVARAITPAGKDMVSYKVYDEYGRERYGYLPYPDNAADGNLKTNPFAAQKQFYDTRFGNTEKVFYGYGDVENSPLQRPVKNYAPGNSWAGSGNGVEVKYLLNGLYDQVQVWTIDDAPGSLPTTSAVYADNTLTKTVVIDEQGGSVVEFKNKEGKVILKKARYNYTAPQYGGYIGYACTYYVYDKYGLLRFVMQPKAVDWLKDHGWSFGVSGGTGVVDELCFRYEYDARNRMIRKKVPGAGWVDMVYDARDRLVMTRDAKMTDWMVTFYDAQSRPIITGFWNTTLSADAHRSAAYGSQQYPAATVLAGLNVLKQTWYDDYSGIAAASGLSAALDNSVVSNGSFYTIYNASPYWAQQIAAGTIIRGLPTGSKTRILGTNNYLYTLMIYDEKGRVIQVKSINASSGADILTTQYDFSGKVLKTYLIHEKTGGTPSNHYVKTKLEYDDAGRIKKVWKNIDNAGTDQLIADNSYNEQGQLVTKKLGTNPANTSQPLESLTYDYNIRGWLNGINKDYAEGFNNNNWFGMTLSYDYGFSQSEGGNPATNYGLLNGNISGWKWRGKSDGEQRAYGYEYDWMNRLRYADFNQLNAGGTWNKQMQGSSNTIDFSVGGDDYGRMTYDVNGNIKKMKQMGLKLNNSISMDDMTYDYGENVSPAIYSNKLLNVTDGVPGASTGLGDFKDVTGSGNDYAYDVNGNMTSDVNKGIASITYNFLNLPEVITVNGKGTITYTYDAAGNKLSKTINETGQPAKTTAYIAGFVYENDVLQFTGHEEGRARPLATGGWTYDYFVKDHLGNVRVMLTQEQKTDVYPAATLEGTAPNEAIGYEQGFYTINSNQVTSIAPASDDNQNYPVPNPNPNGNATALSQKMYKLSSGTDKMGLGITLKVMAGDKINIWGASYYNSTGSSYNESSNTLADILGGFVGALNHTGLNSKGATTGNINNSINGGITTWLNNNVTSGGLTSPKAGICWILFDEQLNYVNSGFSRVGSSGTLKTDHSNDLQNIPVSKSGYLYVFCSNESSLNIYFDNLQVTHVRGPLLEENHYYPFGLSMAGISSRALGFGGAENKYKYSDKEMQSGEWANGEGLEMYDFGARNYDQQIGRWFNVDPLAEQYRKWSPYTFVVNNPLRFIDPDGMEIKESGSGVSITGDDIPDALNAIYNLFCRNESNHESAEENDGNSNENDNNENGGGSDNSNCHTITIYGKWNNRDVPLMKILNNETSKNLYTKMPYLPIEMGGGFVPWSDGKNYTLGILPPKPIVIDLRKSPCDAIMLTFSASLTALGGMGTSMSIVIIAKGQDQGIYQYKDLSGGFGLDIGVGFSCGIVKFNYNSGLQLTRETFEGWSEGYSFSILGRGYTHIWSTTNMGDNFFKNDGKLLYNAYLYSPSFLGFSSNVIKSPITMKYFHSWSIIEAQPMMIQK